MNNFSTCFTYAFSPKIFNLISVASKFSCKSSKDSNFFSISFSISNNICVSISFSFNALRLRTQNWMHISQNWMNISQNWIHISQHWMHNSQNWMHSSLNWIMKEKISFTPMGVNAPGSAHARPSARPPSIWAQIFGTSVKHLSQCLRTHIQSFRTLRQLLKLSKKATECIAIYIKCLFFNKNKW